VVGGLFNMRYKINRDKLSKHPVGCIAGSEADDGRYSYKNIIVTYIDKKIILIRTNLNQTQWNNFQCGEMSKQELNKYI